MTHAPSAMAPIVAADMFEIEAAYRVPYKLANDTLTSARAVLLKLVDADGVIGWGEADPSSSFSGETTADVMRAMQDALLPAVFASATPEPGRIDAALDALMPHQLYAKGAISMALLDILGKRLDTPVSTLLGGALRQSLPVLWPIGNGTADDDAAVIEAQAALGFTTFGLKMGTSPIADEIERIATLEARYGDRFTFVTDANQGWSRAEAEAFLSGVAGSRLVFVEQPVAKDALEDMAALARGTRLAISADESVQELADAARIGALGAASVFSIKSSKNGGPLRAKRISSVAEAFGIRCFMNSMGEFGVTQAASLQHAMTIDNLVDAGHAYMSTLRLAEDPTDFASFVRDGVVHAPQRAGLGIRVDEAHVERLSIATSHLEARAAG